MNERIRELAKEAGITTNLDTDYFERDMNKWVDYYSEKFAELIVRECANLCEGEWDGDADTLLSYEAYNECADAIKEHFGVEP